MSRMFSVDGRTMKTWSVFSGCMYSCSYCNARQLALTRLKNVERYRDGFIPRFNPKELYRTFKPGDWVFVAYMGDISFAIRPEVINILERIREYPETAFLFCTKNPMIYWYWSLHWPENLYLGATIETTEDYELTKAPPPRDRFVAMKALDHPHKFISIEPVCDFDLELMIEWMEEISPDIIEVGADNYKTNLPEPSAAKLRELLKYLSKVCPQVVEKEGLERLKRADQIGFLKL